MPNRSASPARRPYIHISSPANWRWELALGLAEGRSRGRGGYFDRLAHRAFLYLEELAESDRSGRPPDLEGYEDLDAARRMHVRGGDDAILVESGLLAGLDDDEVALRAGTSAGVVAAYHDMFFDVRPMLEAHDWVTVHAVGRRRPEGGLAEHPDTLLRRYAYAGGPPIFDAVAPMLLPLRHLPGELPAMPRDEPLKLKVWLNLCVNLMPDAVFLKPEVRALLAELEAAGRDAERFRRACDALPEAILNAPAPAEPRPARRTSAKPLAAPRRLRLG